MKSICDTRWPRQRSSAIISRTKASPSCNRRAATRYIWTRELFLPHIPVSKFPGVALANELYLEGGIRSVEIGSLMFGEHAKMDLVRLAIPRRVYTQSHIEYVVEVILEVWKKRNQIHGLKLTYEAPFLRHFKIR